MAATKYSRQRECIVDYLASTTSHPTAETVYQSVKSSCPNISLGTVYRNLNLLTDLGSIQKITCGDGFDHFDGNAAPHYHLYCKGCGRVIDLELPVLVELDQLAGRYYDGIIEGHSTVFFGYCIDCKERK